MPISERTIKILFTKAQNKCAYPHCGGPLLVGETILGEICHIRARRKGGPRYDATLSAREKDSLANLIILCPTCHSLVDRDRTGAFTVEWLQSTKAEHERSGPIEIAPRDAKDAMALLAKYNAKGKRAGRQSVVVGKTTANANHGGVAVSIAGDNQGDIHIRTSGAKGLRGYPKDSLGAYASLSGYIDYLCELYVSYTSQLYDPETARKRIGKNIKDKFRVKKRTRNDMPAERFEEVVAFLREKLSATPAGRKHLARGTKLCSTYQEWRTTTR